jgi:hypothetical protein
MKPYTFIVLHPNGAAVEHRGTVMAHDRDHALLLLGAKYHTIDIRRVVLQPNPEIQYAPKEVEITWG